MEKLTFEAGKNMVLDGSGHVNLFKLKPTSMLANTDEQVAKSLGVHHIPREWFVRKVDVEEFATQKIKDFWFKVPSTGEELKESKEKKN